MDFAAATPIHPEVIRAMDRAFLAYGNPSGPHQEGREARALLEEARTKIARELGAKPERLTFTGSGTEGNNLAVAGVIEALIKKGAKPEELHVIASGIEHPSLGTPVAALKRWGVQVSFAEPNEEGMVTPEAVMKLVRKETVLVSIVAVQSEIGVIEPLKEISRALEEVREKREQSMQSLFPETAFPILHTDASQSPLFVDLSPERLGVDMATYDGQKIMGPKGVGVLYKHSSVPLEPLFRGGNQERGLRPGTENAAGAVGMAEAFVLAGKGRKERAARVQKVRDYFAELLQKEIPSVEINGSMKHRIANNINISVPGADGDYLAVLMDAKGVAVSPRFACLGSGGGSQTVAALGKGENTSKGTLRFSFEPTVTKRDVEYAVRVLKESLATASGKVDEKK